jgi:hypothetical protein
VVIANPVERAAIAAMQMVRCSMTRTPTSARELTRKLVCRFGTTQTHTDFTELVEATKIRAVPDGDRTMRSYHVHAVSHFRQA